MDVGERLGKVFWAHKMKVTHRPVRKNSPAILCAPVIKVYQDPHINIHFQEEEKVSSNMEDKTVTREVSSLFIWELRLALNCVQVVW